MTTIAQKPNKNLLITLLSLAFSLFAKKGTTKVAGKSGFASSGLIWALREIIFGVSKFRRFTGLGVAFMILRYLYRQQRKHA